MPHYTLPEDSDQKFSNLPTPGIHFARIQECIEKRTKHDDPMYNVLFLSADDGAYLCYDNIIIGGKAPGIGIRKLKTLGAISKRDGQYVIPPAFDLIGKTVYISIRHVLYNGRTKAEVNFDAGDSFGYFSKEDVDKMASESQGEAPADAIDDTGATPF